MEIWNKLKIDVVKEKQLKNDHFWVLDRVTLFQFVIQIVFCYSTIVKKGEEKKIVGNSSLLIFKQMKNENNTNILLGEMWIE